MTALLFIASAPTKLAPLLPVYGFFAKHWDNLLFRVLCACVAGGVIYVFEIIDFFRPRVRVRLVPSGQGSSELVLGVTNLGSKGIFKATCEVLAGKKAHSMPLNKTVTLKWEGKSSEKITVDQNDSGNLLIASHDLQQAANISWLRLWQLDGDDKKLLTSVGWERTSAEVLPAFDLKISIFREGSLRPEVSYFTVFPESYMGPLKMTRTEVVA